MKPILDIKDTFRDSPDYRTEVASSEAIVWSLESTCKTLLKYSKQQIDLGNEYSAKQILLSTELGNLSKLETDDEIIAQTLSKFSETLYEIERSRKLMLSQLKDVFLDPLDNFLKKDIQHLKDFKRTYEKASDNADSCIDRYLSKPAKDPRILESADEVMEARKDFHEKAMQHAFNLNEFNFSKTADLLENILAYMYTNFAFFHQGYEILKDLEPMMKDLTMRLHDIRVQGEAIAKESKAKKDTLVAHANPLYSPIPSAQTPSSLLPGMSKSGYLMKKGSGKITAFWSRRWFFMRGDYLVYLTRGKNESPTVAANLRLSMVKHHESPDGRRFCFEIISPAKSYILQAENEIDLSEWMSALQEGIGKALNNDNFLSTSPKGMQHGSKEKLDEFDLEISSPGIPSDITEAERLDTIKQIPGNGYCCDCRSENPDWVSINLGCILCIECSGIHRSLGVQVSKVRSLKLDKIEPELVKILTSLGNDVVNSIFEANFSSSTSDIARAHSKSDRTEREKWIHSKYVLKKFVISTESLERVNEELWSSILDENYRNSLKALVQGANIEWKNPSFKNKTVLLQAIETLSESTIQFLLLWNSDLNASDDDGSSALHLAVESGNERIVKLLLRRGIPCNNPNKRGKTPIDLAIDLENANLATTLKLHLFELEKSQPARRAEIVKEFFNSDDQELSFQADDDFDKQIYRSSNSSPVKYSSSPNKTEEEDSSSTSSIKNARTSFSSSFAVASSYAGNAAAYANKLMKSFSKANQDSSSGSEGQKKATFKNSGAKSNTKNDNIHSANLNTNSSIEEAPYEVDL